MKTVLFIFLLCQFQALSQCDTSTAVDFPEVDAQFPGGIVEMKKFILENIEFPEIQLCSMGLTGRVYLTFLVCDNGSIHDIQIMRSRNNLELEQIAINVVKKMPNWIPAEVNDLPVAAIVRFPITICLQ